MYSLKIKTYRIGQETPSSSFYVLCKGLNSGKPLQKPCPNCFVVTAATEEEKEQVYWLSYAIWKGKGYYPLMRGSVIPFITLRDYRQQLEAAKRGTPADAQFHKVVALLQQLDKEEHGYNEKIKTIAQLRMVLFQKYIKMA